MGLDITLYKIINVHECQTKRLKKEKTIYTFNRVFTKYKHRLPHSVPIIYKKYICDCHTATSHSSGSNSQDDIIIYRPRIGAINWSDSVHYGELYDVQEIYSFRFGSYKSFPSNDNFGEMCGWEGGTYRGIKVKTLFENIREEEYETPGLLSYQYLLSRIDDFDAFIIEHN